MSLKFISRTESGLRENGNPFLKGIIFQRVTKKYLILEALANFLQYSFNRET
jgi:hypothetical protein